MSKSMNLDDIRAAAEAKYGDLPITMAGGKTVKLLNALRLPKVKRDALAKMQENLDAEGADQAEVLRDVIRTVADSKAGADALIKEVGDDLAVLAEIFSEYGKGTKLGEASGSQD